MTDRVAVIGAGQMGNGIAHVFAQAGVPVTMIDVSDDALRRGRETIEKNMDRQVKKNTLSADDRNAALGRLATSTDLGSVGNATVVVEAATENTDLKFRIFADLDRIAPAGAVLASNTSSISITRIGAVTKRP
jgi:3-hydroxybutyryl-CoA dehydrogenase